MQRRGGRGLLVEELAKNARLDLLVAEALAAGRVCVEALLLEAFEGGHEAGAL